MNVIREVSYTEARLDWFRSMRAKKKKTLFWWQCQKPNKQYDAQTIQEMCSELGREISYLDDVIEMFEKVGMEG